MGPFATAITVGCLDALRWLLWLVAALLLLLVVVQAARGDEAAAPVKMLTLGAGAAALGFICGWASKRIAASYNP